MKRSNTTVQTARRLARLVVPATLAVWLSGGSALAQCWRDTSLEQNAAHLAQRFGPPLTDNLPEVLLCLDELFPPQVGGDYNTGAHRIRIPVRSAQSPQLHSILAHELAHAVVTLTGLPYDVSRGGHGQSFIDVLRGSGFTDEANRVAWQYGLAQAPGGPGSPSAAAQPWPQWPPAAPVQPPGIEAMGPRGVRRPTCWIETAAVPHFDRHGRFRGYRVDTRQVCS